MTKKIVEMMKNSWFNILIILLFGFSVYWFGIRPVEIRKSCSIVKGHTDAHPAQIASPNYPECEKNPYYNPFLALNSNAIGIPDRDASGSIIRECTMPLDGWPASDWEKPATPAQYEQCLHQDGL